MRQADGFVTERLLRDRDFAATVIVHDVDIAACKRRGRNCIDMGSEGVAAESGLEQSQKMLNPNTVFLDFGASQVVN